MIWLFHGKQPFISQREALKSFTEICAKYPEYSPVKIDCDTAEADTIISTYKTVDMFSAGKNILLKRLTKNKKKEDIFEDLKSFVEKNEAIKLDLINIILWEEDKVASNTRFFKFFNGLKSVTEASEFNKRTFVSWAEKELNASGVKADKTAIYKIAQMVNYEPERFVNELEKYRLSGFEKIDEKVVDKLSADTLEYKIWDLIEQINNKSADNKAKASSILERLFQTNTDPYYILSMINWNLRQVLLAKHMNESGAERNTIASKLRIPPFNISNVLHAGNAFTMAQLENIYEKVNNLDYEMKIGNIEPKTGITLLLTIITN